MGLSREGEGGDGGGGCGESPAEIGSGHPGTGGVAAGTFARRPAAGHSRFAAAGGPVNHPARRRAEGPDAGPPGSSDTNRTILRQQEAYEIHASWAEGS